METTLDINIRAMEPSLKEDYLSFFDNDAFADNPHWASCYCYFNHAPHATEDWAGRSAERNRAAVAAMIDRDELHGYLAYHEGHPIAWCNAGLRQRYTSLDPADDPAAGLMGAIVCFVVARPYRGRGVGRGLLLAACDGFRDRGITTIEAYPRGGETREAANYHGPLAMYLAAGFEVVDERDGVVTVRRHLIG